MSGGNNTDTDDKPSIISKIENFTQLTIAQLGVIVVCYCIVVLTGIFLLQYRIRRRRARLRRIPRSIMPFLRPGDLPTKMRNLIISELSRSHHTHIEPPFNSDDHLGYGQEFDENGVSKAIHFKTVIAASYWVLEKAVLHLNPILIRRPALTVRELFIQENNPKLDRDLCKYYIDMYERARFSAEEFSREDYQAFLDKFQLLLNEFLKKAKQDLRDSDDGKGSASQNNNLSSTVDDFNQPSNTNDHNNNNEREDSLRRDISFKKKQSTSNIPLLPINTIHNNNGFDEQKEDFEEGLRHRLVKSKSNQSALDSDDTSDSDQSIGLSDDDY